MSVPGSPVGRTCGWPAICAVLALASGCGGGGDSAASAVTPTPAPTTPPIGPVEAGGYRLIRPPLITIRPSSSGTPSLRVVVRLNKRLPRAVHDEGYAVSFGLDGVSANEAPALALGPRRRHCYQGNVGNDYPPPSLERPRHGQRVGFQVDIKGVKENIRTIAVLRAPRAARDEFRRLGCTAP